MTYCSETTFRTTPRRSMCYRFGAAFASLLLAACTAVSQEEAKEDSLTYEIQEMVIVATRTQERMIDIPYSVFRVDKKELSYGRKVSAKDVLADVPGLFLQSRYGNHDLRISIRGFGTRSNSGVRGVRILQDGIPESEPDGETVIDAVDFTSLGGVEVVKGNLSSLYGNAPGGVINFASDLYFLDNYCSSTSQVGKFGLKQSGVKLGIANKENRILLSYGYRNLDGFRVHSAEYQHLLNAIYEGYTGTRSSITILGNYVDGLIKLPGSLTLSEFQEDPFQANPLAVSQDFRKVTKKGRLGVRFKAGLGEAGASEFEATAYGGLKEFQKADNELYSQSTRYSLGALLRFSARSELMGHSNRFTVGADLAHQSGPVTEFDNIAGMKGISVQNDYNESLNAVGFYFLDQYSILADRLDVLLSGRFDRNIFSRDIFIPYGFVDTGRTFQQFTPKIGFDLKLTPFVALYTSYGISFDFPALSEMANSPFTTMITPSLNPDLKPQESRNYELGVKGNLLNPGSEWMRKIFFDVTYFHYTVRDEIVPFAIQEQTYFRNAGQTLRDGVEVGFKCEPFEGIELTTNYIYTHFRYGDYLATIYSPSGQTTEDYTGKTVPSVPRHTLNFILNYEFAITEALSGLLGWDCDYIAEMYVDDRNSEKAPGYFYGNILAGLNLSTKFMNIIFYAGSNNIFDRRYVGFININDYYGRFYNTGEPRNIYAGLRVSYKML